MKSLDEIAERLELLALANSSRGRPTRMRSIRADYRAARAEALVRERHDRIARAQALRRTDGVIDLRSADRDVFERVDASAPPAEQPDSPRHLRSFASSA